MKANASISSLLLQYDAIIFLRIMLVLSHANGFSVVEHHMDACTQLKNKFPLKASK